MSISKLHSGIRTERVYVCECVCVCQREGEVEIEMFDAVTAANYCCSIFHTVCLISRPVERDRDSLSLFLTNSLFFPLLHTYTHARTHKHTLTHSQAQGSEGGDIGIVL